MTALHPLRLKPIFHSMLWGGTRLPAFLGRSAPHNGPIGEAWMLSDVEENLSIIANGPLAGRTLRSVLAEYPTEIFGASIPGDGRFPLLFKFLDAKRELSVQVHPNDEQALRLKGPRHRGKTEAWVILNADPQTSRLYSGFRPGVSADDFRTAMNNGTTPETLHAFVPKPGDCVFLRAGTVHAIGADILLFEVQQTSDITYRLYDWDRVDAKTGQPRELHIEHGLLCSDFATGPCEPVAPKRDGDREELVACEYFTLHRHTADTPQMVGNLGECRVLAALAGSGTLDGEPFRAGELVLLPAVVGAVSLVPSEPMTWLEVGLGASA